MKIKLIKKIATMFASNKTRRVTRKIQFCPVSFSYNEEDYRGYLVDLSRDGMKVRVNSAVNMIHVDDIIEFNITTPYGRSEGVCGKIVWSFDDTFGIKFENNNFDVDDPIMCMIDSWI